jgi:dipeptidyl aminopeptidase/acylaminoacyl peptidase
MPLCSAQLPRQDGSVTPDRAVARVPLLVACLFGCGLSLSATGAAPADWPQAADIPRPEPIALGLAGAPEPEVTRYLLTQGVRNVVISPDGRQVAYATSLTGQPQVWVVGSEGGAATQLTFGAGVDDFHWLPDGSGLLYGADTGGDERIGLNVLSRDGTAEKVVLPKTGAFRFFGDFAPDGGHFVYSTTERNGSDMDLYLADLAGGTRELLRGRPGLYAQAWQPGGTAVLVSEARGETGNDLHLLDTATGVLRTLFSPAQPSAYESIAWTPDGKGFYVVTDDGTDRRRLAYCDLATGRLRDVEKPATDVVAAALTPDGRWLLWVVDTQRLPHAARRGTSQAGPTSSLPALPPARSSSRWRGSAAVRGDPRERATGRRAPPSRPGRAGAAARRSGRRPSRGGARPGAKMTVPVSVAFPARDGEQLSGLLYRPAGLTVGGPAPVPVYLLLHGGPSAHADAAFDPEVQYLVARGIAVLDFNYRGSTGAGKRFASLNDRRRRPDELGDLADAVRWIAAQPGLDGARVAVGGASYGGYLTNAVVGTYPDLFVAAVSAVGVSDWVKALEGASPALQASDRLEYGDVRDPSDRAFFASLSPLRNASRVRTPMLVEHGANDPRDPVTESDAFVAAVRAPAPRCGTCASRTKATASPASRTASTTRARSPRSSRNASVCARRRRASPRPGGRSAGGGAGRRTQCRSDRLTPWRAILNDYRFSWTGSWAARSSASGVGRRETLASRQAGSDRLPSRARRDRPDGWPPQAAACDLAVEAARLL